MPTAVTRATRGLRHGVSVAGLAVVALLVTACSDDGDDPVAETTESSTPTPVITAPPTKSPEEKAEAEIIDTFETLIADRDEYYSNASDYGGAQGWNVSLVAQWQVSAEAEMELANQVGAWRGSEVEQRGSTEIATHIVNEVKLGAVENSSHEATSVACLDMSGLAYETYDGESADLPVDPSKYQTWAMSWIYHPKAVPESGIEEPGWYIHSINLSIDEPC